MKASGVVLDLNKKQTMHVDIYGIFHEYRPTGWTNLEYSQVNQNMFLKYTTGFKRQSPFYFDQQLDYITRINIRWDIYIALQSLQDTGQETMDQGSRSAK